MSRGAGRPPKLTNEVQERICQALAAGNYRTVAAQWAGVSQRVMREWMAKGKSEKSGPYKDFRRRVLEAEKSAEIRAVGLVMKAAQEDAKHAQWWLERKFNARWGRKDATRVTGEIKASGSGPATSREVAIAALEALARGEGQ